MFTMATLNLLDHQARPVERFPLIVAGLAAESARPVALQEVSAGPSRATLAAALNDAAASTGHADTYHYAQQTNLRRHDLTVDDPHPPPDPRPGLGRLAGPRPRRPRNHHGHRRPPAGVRLHPPVLEGRPGPEASRPRLFQAGVLADWVAQTFPEIPTIVGGDFNAVPSGLTYAYLAARWASLYAEHHGAEPAWTCPTPLAPTPEGWQGTLDYLWKVPHTAPVQALDARLS